LNKRSKKK